MTNVSTHIYFQSLNALGLLLSSPGLIDHSVAKGLWLFQVPAFLQVISEVCFFFTFLLI